jgi:hypothetical protein
MDSAGRHGAVGGRVVKGVQVVDSFPPRRVVNVAGQRRRFASDPAGGEVHHRKCFYRLTTLLVALGHKPKPPVFLSTLTTNAARQ